MMKMIKAGIIGGLIIYVWYAASWMVLPWHKTTLQQFKDENAVAQIIQANAPVSGVYFMPSMNANKGTAAQDQKQAPMMFSSVYLEGAPANMTNAIVISLITHIVAAFLVAWLLLQTTHLGYFGRLGFIMVFALTAGIVTEVPLWNWFKFDSGYMMVAMGDLLISWFLAGLAMAKICKK